MLLGVVRGIRGFKMFFGIGGILGGVGLFLGGWMLVVIVGIIRFGMGCLGIMEFGFGI